MKSKIFAVTLIVVGVITIVSFVGWFLWKPAPILLQGEIAATSYKISSQMPGRVDSLQIRRGQTVKKGDLLFVITSKTVDAKLTQAEALQTAASAQSTKVDRGARQQIIDQAYQMWQTSLAGLELAQKTYNRVEKLYQSGVIPAQRFDEISAQLAAARNTSKAAQAQYQMAREGAQWEDKVSAAAIARQAGGAVAEVESYINDGAQYSPVDGQIASILSEPGELVGAGFPVATVVDMSDSWVVFNIKETMLPKFTMGRNLRAYVPALGKEYDFTVSFIAPTASYATWSATRTTGEFDIRTFEVHALPTVKNIPNLRTGMSVTVDYDSL